MGLTTPLSLHADALTRLHQHAEEGYPHEVVGVLAGDRAAQQVTRVVPLINERADSPQNRYHVSGWILARAEAQIEAAGQEVVGYYHSHPDHPARYSEVDRDQALPSMAYAIVSVQGGAVADTRCWRLTDDRSEMIEAPLTTRE